MAYQVLMQKLAFQPVDPKDPTVPIGDEEIVQRGDLVPDYVAPYIISALLNSGVIVTVADKPDPSLVPFEAEAPAPTPNPEVPPAPGTLGNVVPLQGDATTTDETPSEPVTEKPTARDSKASWESYAVHVGVPQAEAESMTKADLIAEVERREAL